MSEPAAAAVSPPSVDISPLLANLSNDLTPLSPADASTTKAFLSQAARYPSELEKIVQTWLETNEDAREGRELLEVVLSEVADRDPHALAPLLLTNISSATSRARIMSLLTKLFRSPSLPMLPLTALLDYLSQLIDGLLLDTDSEVVQTLANAVAVGWVTAVTHPTWASWVEESDGAGREVGRLLAAVGRAMTWGWPTNGHEEVGGEEPSEEDERKYSLRDPTLPLAPGVTYERAGSPSLTPPDLSTLLSVLYGLYPSHTLSFLRSPFEYLSHHEVPCPYDVPWSEVLDQTRIRASAPCLLSKYTLNPSLFDPALSPSDELTSPRRFASQSPSTLLSRCLALHSSASPSLPPSPSLTRKDENEPTSLRKLKTELDWQTWVAQSALLAANTAQQAIEIHRANESERQSLHIRLKELRLQLERSQLDNRKLREQAEAAKGQSSKWVESLQERLKVLREEKKRWGVEAVELRSEVSEVRKALKAQGDLLAEAKQELFTLRAQRLEESPKVERMRNFERRIDQLTTAQKLWQEDIRKYKAQREEMDTLLSRWDSLILLLKSERGRAEVLERRNAAAEHRVSEVEAQLAALEARTAAREGTLSPGALEFSAGLQKRVGELERQVEGMMEQRRRDLLRYEEQADLIAQLQSLTLDTALETSFPSPTDSHPSHPSESTPASLPQEIPTDRASIESVRPTVVQLGSAAVVPPVLTKVSTPGGIMARQSGEEERDVDKGVGVGEDTA